MLHLGKIILTHFKNYEHQAFEFPTRVTGITGLNGHGKTNLLDAIYYCCFTKSYFTPADALTVRFGNDGMRLEARFEAEEDVSTLIFINRNNGKKELLLNNVAYTRLSHHVGKFPAVVIAPDDIEIITGGSEGRRKYLDALICQADQVYLQQLMSYNKLLQQRNSLLRQQQQIDETLLDILDAQMAEPARYVAKLRSQYTDELLPGVKSLYAELAESRETAEGFYMPGLQGKDPLELFTQNRARDKMMQRTTSGIHRDDLQFLLDGQPFRNIASQGQRKSLLFALKLAEFDILQQHKGFAPILLLDDVFEKLDADRMHNLLARVCCNNDGQVFITDTHPERLTQAFEKLGITANIIHV